MLTIYDLLKKVKTMYGYGKKTKPKTTKPKKAKNVTKPKANKKAKKTKKKM